MKNLFVLFLFVLGLSVSSCQKEVLHPSKSDSNTISTPRGSNNGGYTSGTIDNSDDWGITDPNKDPDISKIRGQR